ncbi:hypothetical protein Mapa_000738 [Marchantia paleacea]|nr:hypothetical protein Mapa_000738 [Marchantia paleacea]
MECEFQLLCVSTEARKSMAVSVTMPTSQARLQHAFIELTSASTTSTIVLESRKLLACSLEFDHRRAQLLCTTEWGTNTDGKLGNSTERTDSPVSLGLKSTMGCTKV